MKKFFNTIYLSASSLFITMFSKKKSKHNKIEIEIEIDHKLKQFEKEFWDRQPDTHSSDWGYCVGIADLLHYEYREYENKLRIENKLEPKVYY